MNTTFFKKKKAHGTIKAPFEKPSQVKLGRCNKQPFATACTEKSIELKKGYQKCPKFSAGFAKQKVQGYQKCLNLSRISLGQGTIEYLVIIAIIVVIGLVVATLATSMFDSQQVKTTMDKISSNIGQGGISVTDSVVDISGNGFVSLKNNSGETLTIKSINTDNQENSFEQILPQNASKTFSLNDLNIDCDCSTGNKTKTCNFTIEYTSKYGLEKKEVITITVDCVTNASPSNPSSVAGLGSGTLADPWIINSCQELQAMDEHLDGNYALGANINCYNTRTWNSGAGFDPIGNYTADLNNTFSGSLNGRNYSISNLYINRPNSDRVGLFNSLENSTIENIFLTDINFVGDTSVGGLSGSTYSTQSSIMTNITLTGEITGNSIVGKLIGFSQIGSFSCNSITTNILTNCTSNCNSENCGDIQNVIGYTMGIPG
jgi:hypothetical protein